MEVNTYHTCWLANEIPHYLDKMTSMMQVGLRYSVLSGSLIENAADVWVRGRYNEEYFTKQFLFTEPTPHLSLFNSNCLQHILYWLWREKYVVKKNALKMVLMKLFVLLLPTRLLPFWNTCVSEELGGLQNLLCVDTRFVIVHFRSDHVKNSGSTSSNSPSSAIQAINIPFLQSNDALIHILQNVVLWERNIQSFLTKTLSKIFMGIENCAICHMDGTHLKT